MQYYESATPRAMSPFEKMYVWYVKNPVLIYTMGKVGSSSIVQGLREKGVHEVQPHSLTFSRRGSYFVKADNSTFQNFVDFYKSILMKLKFYLYLKSKATKHIKVISIVRDPLSRNVSAFFEQIQYVIDRPVSECSTDELISLFWSNGQHEAPLIWFDNELKSNLGVDVYSKAFNKERGYTLYECKNVSVLVVKLEMISELDSVIGDFIGVPDYCAIASNRGEYKEYSSVYRDFKEKVRFPKDYLDKLYSSKYAKHFYSESEIDEFRSRVKYEVL